MRKLAILVLPAILVVAGCNSPDSASLPSKPVSNATTAAPGKGAVQGAEASFNGPGAANADSRVGSKGTK